MRDWQWAVKTPAEKKAHTDWHKEYCGFCSRKQAECSGDHKCHGKKLRDVDRRGELESIEADTKHTGYIQQPLDTENPLRRCGYCGAFTRSKARKCEACGVSEFWDGDEDS